MQEIDIELYIKNLNQLGVDTKEVEIYLENLISSSALRQLPEAQ